MEEKSAGFIVFKRDKEIKFLILKRADKDYWEFPKGHTDQDGSDLAAARRELLEETGIKNIKIVYGFNEVVTYLSSTTGNKRVFVFFLCKTDDEVKLSREHSEYAWLTINEAKNLLTHNDWINILEKALKSINNK